MSLVVSQKRQRSTSEPAQQLATATIKTPLSRQGCHTLGHRRSLLPPLTVPISILSGAKRAPLTDVRALRAVAVRQLRNRRPWGKAPHGTAASPNSAPPGRALAPSRPVVAHSFASPHLHLPPRPPAPRTSLPHTPLWPLSPPSRLPVTHTHSLFGPSLHLDEDERVGKYAAIRAPRSFRRATTSLYSLSR